MRAAPRGHGKSQILSFAYPLWCALYGYAKNILIVSDTAEQAIQFVMAIKDELAENELILDTFGNKEGSVWAQQKIITRDKIQIVGKGAGQKLAPKSATPDRAKYRTQTSRRGPTPTPRGRRLRGWHMMGGR